MGKQFFTIAALFLAINCAGQKEAGIEYKKDFDYFWVTIRDNYCYWDKKATDWERVHIRFGPVADTVSSRESFISLLERVFYELYDHHASLNTNTALSERLVPSGANIWAEYVNGKPKIIEVRPGSDAEKAGMRSGMEVYAVDDVAVGNAILRFLPTCLKHNDDEANNYALRELLAGDHSKARKITLLDQGERKDFYPDQVNNLLEIRNRLPIIESKVFNGNVGYIRINNSLGDNDLIRAFDAALDSLINSRAVILDLRNTPSGGNTTVARAIMGRFINKEGFFQKHELTSEERETGIKRSWVEIVSPRKPTYNKPLLILVDHWTGSVGEGIVIGFDALKRGTIMGTRMAALNGAVYSFQMPSSGIGFSFPAEKIFQVNGEPRENYRPRVLVDQIKNSGNDDQILNEALKYISVHCALKK